MNRIVPSLFFLFVATPAFAGVTVGKPFAEPPKDPDQICVDITNSGAAAEKVHVSLADVAVGGAMPSAKAGYTVASPTQEVSVPPGRTIARGTITAKVPGTVRVCWKVRPIPGHTYWAVAGTTLDKDGDVPISEGDYNSFKYVPPKKPERPD